MPQMLRVRIYIYYSAKGQECQDVLRELPPLHLREMLQQQQLRGGGQQQQQQLGGLEQQLGGGGEKRTLALLALAATYLIQIMISMIFDYGSTSTTVLYTCTLYDQGELFVEQFSLLYVRYGVGVYTSTTVRNTGIKLGKSGSNYEIAVESL